MLKHNYSQNKLLRNELKFMGITAPPQQKKQSTVAVVVILIVLAAFVLARTNRSHGPQPQRVVFLANVPSITTKREQFVETREAIQAAARREKLDQQTIKRLHREGYIDVCDATHM
jgi:hypothetical protein